VTGAPNVTLIFDAAEVDDQEYDTLLRDEKEVELLETVCADRFAEATDALVIPGTYDLGSALKVFKTRAPSPHRYRVRHQQFGATART